jgi:hypothetical protein
MIGPAASRWWDLVEQTAKAKAGPLAAVAAQSRLDS